MKKSILFFLILSSIGIFSQEKVSELFVSKKFNQFSFFNLKTKSGKTIDQFSELNLAYYKNQGSLALEMNGNTYPLQIEKIEKDKQGVYSVIGIDNEGISRTYQLQCEGEKLIYFIFDNPDSDNPEEVILLYVKI